MVVGEVDDAGERRSRSPQRGLDPGGRDPLALVVHVDDLLARPAAERLREIGPRRVADPVPEPQHRAEVGRSGSGEERRGDDPVAVRVVVALEQAERDHGVGADPCGAARQAGARSQRIEARRTVGERLEEAELVRGEQVLGRHEPGGQPHDRLGRDGAARAGFEGRGHDDLHGGRRVGSLAGRGSRSSAARPSTIPSSRGGSHRPPSLRWAAWSVTWCAGRARSSSGSPGPVRTG
jgi:hypothetical protein